MTLYGEGDEGNTDGVASEKKYGEQIPIWVAVEALTFGSLSKLYSILPMQRQKEIAKTYGELDHELFENWLHMCVDLRNICAHYDRIYCFRFVKGIKVEKHIEKQIKQAIITIACTRPVCLHIYWPSADYQIQAHGTPSMPHWTPCFNGINLLCKKST